MLMILPHLLVQSVTHWCRGLCELVSSQVGLLYVTSELETQERRVSFKRGLSLIRNNHSKPKREGGGEKKRKKPSRVHHFTEPAAIQH